MKIKYEIRVKYYNETYFVNCSNLIEQYSFIRNGKQDKEFVYWSSQGQLLRQGYPRK